MVLKRQLSTGRVSLDPLKSYEARHVILGVFSEDTAITLVHTRVEDATLPDRGDTWPLLTPIFFDSVVSGWKVWTAGRAIEGFLLGATGTSSRTGPYLHGMNATGRLQLSATDEVQGLVIIQGQVWYPELPLPPGETILDFESALKSGLREDGIHVMGLSGVH